MARRLNTRQSKNARACIQTTKLIKRLEEHALGVLQKKNQEMSDSQVRAALGLLKKTLADLQAVEHSGGGDDGGPVRVHLYIPDNQRNPAKPG